ncbi:unnamed protein product [Musa hybrid cultivar]
MCRGEGNAVPAEQWISGPWSGARLRAVSIGCVTDTFSALLLRQKTSTAGKSEPKTLNLERAISMAKSSTSMEKLKGFLSSQISDEEKWALNSKLLRAAGLFAASIVLMRNFGDLMAI